MERVAHPLAEDLLVKKVDVAVTEDVTEIVDMEDYEYESADSDSDDVINFEVFSSDSD